MSDDVSAGDMIDPTPLQHTMGKVVCTMMRAALPTALDRELVLAIIASAAHVHEDWDRFKDMVLGMCHNAVLDMTDDDSNGEVAWESLAAAMRAATTVGDDKPEGVRTVPPYDEIMGHYMSYLDRLKAPAISWEQWTNRYGSLTDEVLDLDSPIVRATDCHFVWTECSDSHGGWVALPGFEILNRSGYWLSEQPWEDGDQVVVRIAHPSDKGAEEEGRPWSKYVRSQAHKRLRDLIQAVAAASATAYTDCSLDPSDVEHFRSALDRTVDEIAKMIARLQPPDEPGRALPRKSQ